MTDDNPKPELVPREETSTVQNLGLDSRGGEDSETRRPLVMWDRTKILVLLLVLWTLSIWYAAAQQGIYESEVAACAAAGDSVLGSPGLAESSQCPPKPPAGPQNWLLLVMVLEAARQMHYLIGENSRRYYQFWTKKFFGGFERFAQRRNDWTRFRVSRALKWIFWFGVIDILMSRALNVSPIVALVQLPLIVWQALPLLLQLLVAVFFIIIQFGALFWFLSRGGVDVYFPDDIKTRFKDVWGQDNVLAKIKENIVFLEQPEKIEEKGGYVPGGVLLWGPPGTGKTLMAEAVAGETGKPFVFVDPGSFINMFMGVGILKVKGLFRKLRKLAVRYGGVIVFFDEADSLGSRGAMTQGGPWGGQGFGSHLSHVPACNGLTYLDPHTSSLLFRSSMSSGGAQETRGPSRIHMMMGGMMGGGGMGTLNALLTELSGLKKPRGFFNRIVRRMLGMRPKPPPKYRILVMMATNLPQALDEAMLRPGRIDRIYKVGYPSKSGRIRTFRGYLDKVRHELTEQQVDKLATITPYATGATIKDTVNEALINAIREGRSVISWKDVIKAKQLKDLGPPEDVEYIERERHAVAVHEACHAVIAYRMRKHLTIDIATIEKGGTYLGMVASIPPEDQFTRWRSEYEADIMVSLASLIGERIFFEGDSSSGVSGDLESATMIATLMEGYWGMGRTVASHGVTHDVGIGGGGRPGKRDGRKGKDLLDTDLHSRIEDKLEELMQRTEQVIRKNRGEILAVAHALETHKTVTGDDVEAIIEGQQGPLIDGRPYASQEFTKRAEQYHTEVLSAHKAHSQPRVALPVLTGPPFGSEIVASGADASTAEE